MDTERQRDIVFVQFYATPPDHFPSFLCQSTVPNLVVRKTFALKLDSLLHVFDNASISADDGKVFSSAPERGFWTCGGMLAMVAEM